MKNMISCLKIKVKKHGGSLFLIQSVTKMSEDILDDVIEILDKYSKIQEKIYNKAIKKNICNDEKN